MQVEQPPFSAPKTHLSWQEKAELSPLVIPAIAFAVGIVAGFSSKTMPHFVVYGTIAAAVVAVVLTAMPRIRLRDRTASALRLAMMSLTIAAVAGAGWSRAAIKLRQTAIPMGGATLAYRAVVTQSSLNKRSARLDLAVIDGPLRGHKIKATIWREPDRVMPQLASALQVSSTIMPTNLDSRPSRSGFSFDRWIFSHGFSGTTTIYPENWQFVRARWDELPRADAVRLKASLWQQRLSSSLLSVEGDDGAMSIATAMTLGDKRAISKELRQVYSATGAGHLLALSGWHLGLIYFLFLLILPTRRHRQASLLVATIAVWSFVIMVGMPVSAVRAAVMLTVYAVADVSNRGRQPLNTIALAALIILAVEPAACYDVGFQMSVMAVVGIALFYRRFCTLVRSRWFQPIAVSLSAQIGVGPIVAYHFHTFSTYFLLTNLVAMPIAMIGVYAAAVSLLLLPISLLSGLTAFVAQSACACLNATLSLISSLPCACVRVDKMDMVGLLLIYTALVCFAIAAFRLRRVAERRHRRHQIIAAGNSKKTAFKAHRAIEPDLFSQEDFEE